MCAMLACMEMPLLEPEVLRASDEAAYASVRDSVLQDHAAENEALQTRFWAEPENESELQRYARRKELARDLAAFWDRIDRETKIRLANGAV